MIQIDPSCPFCDIKREKKIYRWINSIPKNLLKYNRYILYSNKHFVVVPDISPIVKFHVLIIPKVHYNSLSELPDSCNVYLEKAKAYINTQLLDIAVGKVIYFEHGTCDSMGSACVSHAHLHCLPLQNSEIQRLLLKLNVIEKTSDAPADNESYLSVNIELESYRWADDFETKQFLRKLIAETVEHKERINWQASLLDEKQVQLTEYWLNSLITKFTLINED